MDTLVLALFILFAVVVLAIPTYRVKNYAVLAIQLFCGLIATLDIVAHLMGFI